jgi:G3E family GTPase
VPGQGRGTKRGKGTPNVITTSERFARFGQGCSCCTVRTDIRTKILRIAAEQSADQVVIQTSPETDLTILAKTFTVADPAGRSLVHDARIDSLVMVIDVPGAVEQLRSNNARELFRRIELANVLWLVGASDVSPEGMADFAAVCEAINPRARVVRVDEQAITLDAVRAEQAFSLDHTQQQQALVDLLVKPDSTEGAVSRFVFRSRRPFHPRRLHALVRRGYKGVVRASGTCWVASHSDLVVMFDVAGDSWHTKVAGAWWASVPVAHRPSSPRFQAYLQSMWHPDFGDRHNELAVLGLHLDVAGFQQELRGCLLTDEELAHPQRWPSFPNPFKWPEISA